MSANITGDASPKSLNENEQYGAVTIDTQAFNRSSFNFSGGLLAQLNQLKNNPVKLVISTIVINEVNRQLKAKIRASRNTILSSIKDLQHFGISAKNPDLPDDEMVASKDILQKFLSDTDASLIRAEEVDTKRMLDLYFNSQPPFEKEKKKNEFPDAMALLTMEKWAADNQKKILAVSYDGDWKSFAKNSAWIDVVDTIDDALSIIQELNGKLDSLIRKFIGVLALKSDASLAETFTEELSDAIQWVSLEGEGDSYLSVEFVDIEAKVTDYTIISQSDNYPFKIVRIDNDCVVISIKIELQIYAESFADMSVYDSIDKDHVSLGSSHVETNTDTTATALITISTKNEEDLQIEKVELTDSYITIEFGYVVPDWEPEDDH